MTTGNETATLIKKAVEFVYIEMWARILICAPQKDEDVLSV